MHAYNEMGKLSNNLVAITAFALAFAISEHHRSAAAFMELPSHSSCKIPLRQSVVLEASNPSHQNQRAAVGGILFGSVLAKPAIARAIKETPSQQSTMPYASLDALLPAARVKLAIDRSVTIASDLLKNDSTNSQQAHIQELQGLLLKRQNYTRSYQLADVPKRPAKQYLETYKKNINN